MNLSRRRFLQYCTAAAASIGLSQLELLRLGEALANPSAPKVIWLIGSSCCGCSVSFLNRISATAPTDAVDVIANAIDLVFHQVVMGATGETAVAQAEAARAAGNYILIVEGGVPTAFGGGACVAWNYQGKDYTFQDVVKTYAAGAAKVLCVGECACFGGIPAAPPNPTGIVSVATATGKSTIHMAGCPCHPDWLCWAVVQLLTGASIAVDSNRRPTAIYGRTVHSMCPYRETEEANTFGVYGHCMKELGCRGPECYANCSKKIWNNNTSWCAESGAPCFGCTSPNFPGGTFYTHGD